MKRFFWVPALLLLAIGQFAAIGQTCTVTGCRWYTVNLRSGPGTRYAKVSELYQGYQLEVLGKKGRWYKVSIIDPPEGKTGWVRNNFVSMQ